MISLFEGSLRETFSTEKVSLKVLKIYRERMIALKLISWNVNGLRACMNKGFMNFFSAEDADIFAVQEIKMAREQADFDFPSYHQYWNPAVKKGYSGTAVFTKTEPLNCQMGIGIEEHDSEGRVILLEYKDFYFANVYTPNSKSELERLDYRQVWEDEFRNFVVEKSQKKPVIIAGDLNVAHQEIDLKNPKKNTQNPGFTIQEREKMTSLLNAGFVDTFRYKYPETAEAYTWWSYRAGARQKNAGWRIDYFIVSKDLTSKVSDALIYSTVYGSDHCPVGLILDDI